MDDDLARALGAAIGEAKVLVSDAERHERRHDYWFLSQLDDAQARPAPAPRMVVRPTCVEDVVAIVNECRSRRAPVVPFGLGSGVVGGVLASRDSVVLDMSTMNRVREIHQQDLLASFDAGVRGSEAEEAVNGEGLTTGHYPQSIAVSSVGGWVATRAAGQFSTGYGNIEDIVHSIEAVLPNGDVLTSADTPRAASGPDLRHLLLGSEGTLGVVTGVTLSLRRTPACTRAAAYYVSTMPRGFELQREVVQRGWALPVMRLYDAQEVARNFSPQVRGEDALLLVVSAGPADRVQAELAALARIAAELGCDAAPKEAADGWLDRRNHVPAFKSFIDAGVVVDTIEVAARWSRIEGVYTESLKRLSAIDGVLAASAHSSHVYRSGINLYFTFAVNCPDRTAMRDTYLRAWNAVIEATLDMGGGIAHHHGIGRVRRDYLGRELGETGLATLGLIKRALDPDLIMNPGALIPD